MTFEQREEAHRQSGLSVPGERPSDSAHVQAPQRPLPRGTEATSGPATESATAADEPIGRYLLGAVQLTEAVRELGAVQQRIERMLSYLGGAGWRRDQLLLLRSARDDVAVAVDAVAAAAAGLRGHV